MPGARGKTLITRQSGLIPIGRKSLGQISLIAHKMLAGSGGSHCQRPGIAEFSPASVNTKPRMFHPCYGERLHCGGA
jgi:hypothetical protein